MMMNHLSCRRQAQTQRDNTVGGPVAILWDIEHCPVPCGVQAENVAGNIRKALHIHPAVKGSVTLFSAYGDFNAFSRRLRAGCQLTGVKLVDVPSGRKLATDKAILVDMFLFALDNRPPASILLISGDVDFSPALHILGQRGYTIIVVAPAILDAESPLRSAGRFLWDWPTVARGEGFVPQRILPHECELAGFNVSCQGGGQKSCQSKESLSCRKLLPCECSALTEMDPACLHKHTHTPRECNGTHLFSKCKTSQGSCPAEASTFNQSRWEEQSLQVRSFDTGKNPAKKLKMKQKEYSAPAKINPISHHKYNPGLEEFNGAPHSSAECNGSDRVLCSPNSSEVLVVDQNRLLENTLPMKSLEIDNQLADKGKNELGTSDVDPTCHCRYCPNSKKFSGIPDPLPEYKYQQSLPSDTSEVLVVENGLPQGKVHVQSSNINMGYRKNRRGWRKRRRIMEQLENHEPATPDFPFKYHEEHNEPATPVFPFKYRQEHNEPATPDFPFKYRQVPVESNRTRNTRNDDSLKNLPSNPSEKELKKKCYLVSNIEEK